MQRAVSFGAKIIWIAGFYFGAFSKVKRDTGPHEYGVQHLIATWWCIFAHCWLTNGRTELTVAPDNTAPVLCRRSVQANRQTSTVGPRFWFHTDAPLLGSLNTAETYTKHTKNPLSNSKESASVFLEEELVSSCSDFISFTNFISFYWNITVVRVCCAALFWNDKIVNGLVLI